MEFLRSYKLDENKSRAMIAIQIRCTRPCLIGLGPNNFVHKKFNGAFVFIRHQIDECRNSSFSSLSRPAGVKALEDCADIKAKLYQYNIKMLKWEYIAKRDAPRPPSVVVKYNN